MSVVALFRINKNDAFFINSKMAQRIGRNFIPIDGSF
jgi:hypothetical protein